MSGTISFQAHQPKPCRAFLVHQLTHNTDCLPLNITAAVSVDSVDFPFHIPFLVPSWRPRWCYWGILCETMQLAEAFDTKLNGIFSILTANCDFLDVQSYGSNALHTSYQWTSNANYYNEPFTLTIPEYLAQNLKYFSPEVRLNHHSVFRLDPITDNKLIEKIKLALSWPWNVNLLPKMTMERTKTVLM